MKTNKTKRLLLKLIRGIIKLLKEKDGDNIDNGNDDRS